MTRGALLDVRGLCAGYGASQVLSGVDLAIEAGAIVGVLSRNGMRQDDAPCARSWGLVHPTAGSTRSPARRSERADASDRASGIALVPEGRQVFPNLSVEEHRTAFARPGRGGAERLDPGTRARDLPALRQRLDHWTRPSGGEQQISRSGARS
jgi:branched-chain amino acid transport system ATP-binding protein